ncbi:MAG: tetratricopeptide repeat protein [Planctomycetota bacterium]
MFCRILISALIWQCLALVAFGEEPNAERERSPERSIGADALLNSGKYAEALSAYQAVLSQRPDDVRARLGVSRTFLESGRYDEAEQSLEFFSPISATRITAFNAAEMLDFSKGVWLLARRSGNKELFHKVVGEYLPRIEQLDKANPELYVFWGECYLEKGEAGEAVACFKDALKIDSKSEGALLGIARASFYKDPLSARPLIGQILNVNPNCADALALRAVIELVIENNDEAIKSIEQAMAVNPNSACYRGIRAGAYYLDNQMESFRNECVNMLVINKKPAEFYLALGDCCLKRILYMDAQPFYQKAIGLDPHCWDAYVELGLNSLRLGAGLEAQGRKLLQESFQRDPFNLTVFNTLKVLEGLDKEYLCITTTHFSIKIHKDEKTLLAPYVSQLLEDCYDRFTKAYKFEPEQPLAVEVLADHNDFSVRTLGVPGFGALGVCFAKTFLVLSPGVQDQLAHRFHWGAITAHEFMHIITLQSSKFRVPRWFTEGCSVYAEKMANPIWGREPELEIIDAYREGKLEHLTQFNKSRKVDILHTYLLSSLIIEYIHKTYGMDKIISMLRSFGQGKNADQAFKDAIDKTIAEFDPEFFKYLEDKIIKANDIKLFEETFKKAQEFYNQDKYQEAITEFERAKKIFPHYTKPLDNPYYHLIRIYDETGQKDKLVAELGTYVGINQLDFELRQKLYRIYYAEKQWDKLIPVLEETIYLEPENIQLHYYLAQAYTAKKEPRKAIVEYDAALSLAYKLSPTLDSNLVIADFYCNIAELYLESGDKSKAKESVLEATKLVPDDKRADKILKRCE